MQKKMQSNFTKDSKKFKNSYYKPINQKGLKIVFQIEIKYIQHFERMSCINYAGSFETSNS